MLNSPAVADGVVYAGDETGYLYAFAPTAARVPAPKPSATKTCTALWRGKAANPIYAASPVVHGGMVYTTSFAAAPDSFLEVFAAAGCGKAVCKPVWRGTGGDYMNGAPAIAYGRVYLGSGDGLLRVYPAKGCGNPTCPPLWTGLRVRAGGRRRVAAHGRQRRRLHRHGTTHPGLRRPWLRSVHV